MRNFLFTMRSSVAFGLLLLSSSAYAAAAPVAPPLPTESLGGAFLRMCGSLAIVFGLLFFVIWGLKKWQGLGFQRISGSSANLRIVESKSIGARQSLLVVAYKQERMLVASTPQGISLVSRLPEAPDAEIIEMPPSPSFADALLQVWQGKMGSK